MWILLTQCWELNVTVTLCVTQIENFPVSVQIWFLPLVTFAKMAATDTPGPFRFYINTLSYTKECKLSSVQQAFIIDLL